MRTSLDTCYVVCYDVQCYAANKSLHNVLSVLVLPYETKDNIVTFFKSLRWYVYMYDT